MPPVKARKGFFGFMRRHPAIAIGGSLVLLMVLVAIFAPFLFTTDPTALAPARRTREPSAMYWFGTDMLGRDIYSRVLYGARVSLLVGFAVAEGPEMEDDWHNFTALNFPPEHPARDMQDTFFLARNPDWALRTHTSNVQVRTMESQKPPIRIIAPGRVFRNEAISSRSHCMFHQIEGLYLDRKVSFADMKQTLLEFAQAFFGEKTAIRLRPSYFPFTEPSAEMDIWWGLETEADYRMTKGTGWLEILGCGMVDPAVLESCGIDPQEFSGFAFGLGVERIAMQRFAIPDIRALFDNDLRLLRTL
jgi:phenylalanyl-tRNA synthetase alpha chain